MKFFTSYSKEFKYKRFYKILILTFVFLLIFLKRIILNTTLNEKDMKVKLFYIIITITFIVICSSCKQQIEIEPGKIEIIAKDHTNKGEEIALFMEEGKLKYRSLDGNVNEVKRENVYGFRNEFAEIEDCKFALEYKQRHPDLMYELGEYTSVLRSINLKVYDPKVRNCIAANRDSALVQRIYSDVMANKKLPGLERAEYINEFKKYMNDPENYTVSTD